MNDLRVTWIHRHDDDPVELLSEIDGDRREVRKVEVFGDGSMGFAGPDEAVGSTMLSVVPLPAVDEIAADPQFRPRAIGRAEFEAAWQAARQAAHAG